MRVQRLREVGLLKRTSHSHFTSERESELHDLPLIIHVGCKRREDTGELTNEVKGYSKKQSPDVGAVPGGNSKPPWSRS